MCRGIVVEENRLDYWGGGVERSTLVRLYLVAAVVKILRGGSRWNRLDRCAFDSPHAVVIVIGTWTPFTQRNDFFLERSSKDCYNYRSREKEILSARFR